MQPLLRDIPITTAVASTSGPGRLGAMRLAARRGPLLLLLIATLVTATGQAQSSSGDPQAGDSDKAMRLRRQIEDTRKHLADLEGQLAAEEQQKREEEAAAETKRHQEQWAAKEKLDQVGQGFPQPTLSTAAPHRSIERTFGLNIIADQKAFWTSPLRLHLDDANWLVPFAAATATLVGSDTSIEKELPTSPTLIQRSRSFSNYSLVSLAGAAGGMYLWGSFTQNEHARETGFLGGEAMANTLLSTEAIKLVAGRDRPFEGNGKGEFWQGGSSFPSEHAAAAWSLASVVAHEYPGTMTKLLAYGTASAISAARVLGREHFSSDVFVGSALGWYMGRQVYRAHHNPELGGAEWGTFERSHEPRKPENMGSPYVLLDTWIYPALDRLAALGYVPTGFAGIRPWTRMECARLVQEAGGLIQQGDVEGGEAARLYHTLADEFSPEVRLLDGGRNVGAEVESVYTRFTGISGTPLTDGYHFGQTIINDYGRPFGEGANIATGLSARAAAGPFAFYIRGEYQHAPPAPALSDQARQVIGEVDWGLPTPPPSVPLPVDRFRLLDAYVAVNLKNYQFSFGKQSLWWGPGQGSPMMFSDNAEPITMLRINRTTPFKLPSIFGWLGPMRTEFFLGQLAGQEFVHLPAGVMGQFGRPLDPQPYIHGEKFSFKPTPNLEVGFSATEVFAGAGVPLTWHSFFRSFSTNNAPPTSGQDPGDGRSGLDFQYKVPGLRKRLTFYADGFADDQFSPIAYWDRSAWRAGIYIPEIPRFHRLDFRAEGVYTDLPIGGAVSHGFFYSNTHYLNGYTNLGNLMGSWIGRQGQGAQAWSTYWLSPRKSIQFNYRHQKVSKDFIPNGGTLSDVGVRADLWVRPDLSISSNIQYEQWNFPVLVPGAQSNVTGSLQLTFWPNHWKLEGPR